MQQQPRNTLKSYFQTGDRPTQAQFAELIDSFLNKEDENIKVDAGNIGIGLPSNLLPTEKLEVNGNIKATGLIAENLRIGTSTTPNFVLTSDADGNATWQDPLQVSNDGDWELGTDIVFNLNDNIGIGVDDPTAKLEVLGDIQASGGDIKISGQKSLLFSSHGGGFTMTDATWIRTVGDKGFYHNTGILRTDGELQVGNNGERFLVNSNGDVGIGTDTPEANLHIMGTVKIVDGTQGLGKVLVSDANGNASWESPGLKIGDYYQGGVIFYLDTSGEHGLICAVEDHLLTVPWTQKDGNNDWIYNDTRAYGNGPRAGYHNTLRIDWNINGSGDCAAKICLDWVEGIFSDWYLPSIVELNLMYLNKDIINSAAIANGGASFGSSWYWSSTEYGSGYAWRQNFDYGSQYNYYKNYSLRVRAIRAF